MSDLHGCTHGWKDGHGFQIECIDCLRRRLTDELSAMNGRREWNESQLVQIAEYLGKDATHAPAEDRTIAGLVIAELKRMTAERDEAREIAKVCHKELCDQEYQDGDREIEAKPPCIARHV